jgi:hypothetical protein
MTPPKISKSFAIPCGTTSVDRPAPPRARHRGRAAPGTSAGRARLPRLPRRDAHPFEQRARRISSHAASPGEPEERAARAGAGRRMPCCSLAALLHDIGTTPLPRAEEAAPSQSSRRSRQARASYAQLRRSARVRGGARCADSRGSPAPPDPARSFDPTRSTIRAGTPGCGVPTARWTSTVCPRPHPRGNRPGRYEVGVLE